MRVTLGYSPCPNDTFVFCGLIHGQIAGAPVCEEVLADIETLNEMALREQLDATKISFHALAHLRGAVLPPALGGCLGEGMRAAVGSAGEAGAGRPQAQADRHSRAADHRSPAAEAL